MRRAQQRRAAVIALYQHDLTGRRLEESFSANDSAFVRALAGAAAEHAEELDEVIDRNAHGWSVGRIQPLERSILRVALVEMLHRDAVPSDEPIPAEGATEEAGESAKLFCGSDAHGFVTAVPGAVQRQLPCDSPARPSRRASMKRCATRCWRAESGSARCSRLPPRGRWAWSPSRSCRWRARSS